MPSSGAAGPSLGGGREICGRESGAADGKVVLQAGAALIDRALPRAANSTEARWEMVQLKQRRGPALTWRRPGESWMGGLYFKLRSKLARALERTATTTETLWEILDVKQRRGRLTRRTGEETRGYRGNYSTSDTAVKGNVQGNAMVNYHSM